MRFDAELWEHNGNAAWVFLTVPERESDEINDTAPMPPKGFGSVRVEVTIGGSTWRTSVFPESKTSYVLPVKKAIRKAEDIEPGDTVQVDLVVLLDE